MPMEAVMMNRLWLLLILSFSIGNVVSENIDSEGKGNLSGSIVDPCEASCACQVGFTMLASRKCYMFSLIERTWSEAQAVCESAGATLAYPVNPVENTVLVTYLSSQFTNRFIGWFLGGYDPAKTGQWRWAHNNASITYFDWEPGQPDNTSKNQLCLQYYVDTWQWSHVFCDITFPFVCQQL